MNYSCYQGGWFGSGTGNIDADPLFVDAAGGDLALTGRSPCIDAADGDKAPATDIEGKPRYDHRTVVVHFSVSAPDQVERIKRLGAIVSGNPYYVTALADKYRSLLGPERADQMVRMGDVERAGISYSFHADMPMAPGQPLFLMHCGVNRITTSGRVAGEDQRVSREGALKAVTLEAAYSLQLENKVGSIVAGKLANFTILDDNPVTCDPKKINDIGIWGTIHDGRFLPVMQFAGNAQTALGPVANELTTAAASVAHRHDHHQHDGHSVPGCFCTVNRVLQAAFASLRLSEAGIRSNKGEKYV